MPSLPPTLLRALGRDERGTSVVELALMLPFLILLTVGIVDLSNGIGAQFGLNKAVHRTLELATANTLATNKDASEVDYGYLVAETAKAAQVPEDQVTLTKWLECDGARQTDFEGSCDSGEYIARYVQIQVYKIFSPTFSIGPVGEALILSADAAVRVQ